MASSSEAWSSGFSVWVLGFGLWSFFSGFGPVGFRVWGVYRNCWAGWAGGWAGGLGAGLGVAWAGRPGLAGLGWAWSWAVGLRWAGRDLVGLKRKLVY